MRLAQHPLVSGTKRAGLFWFSISPVFTTPEVRSGINESRPTSVYLHRPEIVLDPIWALPDHSLHGLADIENSSVHTRLTPIVNFRGSPQEFDQTRILGRFLEHDEFGPSGRHALGFQQQVVEVFVAAAASQQ